jgi:hypothetical protein
VRWLTGSGAMPFPDPLDPATDGSDARYGSGLAWARGTAGAARANASRETASYESAAQMSVAVPRQENCVVAPLASIVKVILPTKS